MSELPHLKSLFQAFRRGQHLSWDDGELFTALDMNFEAYEAYFGAIGLRLIRHERGFFYFEPEAGQSGSEMLPKVAVFSFILIDHLASEGRSIEEAIMTERFLIPALPHFSLDRYRDLLREVKVTDVKGLGEVIAHMAKIGWLRRLGAEEFEFLRPFHRILDKCLELSASTDVAARPTPVDFEPPNDDSSGEENLDEP
jgi:hypothetical protein